eukprot:9851313-Lingulodinium_polyedra.AAC.1
MRARPLLAQSTRWSDCNFPLALESPLPQPVITPQGRSHRTPRPRPRAIASQGRSHHAAQKAFISPFSTSTAQSA